MLQDVEQSTGIKGGPSVNFAIAALPLIALAAWGSSSTAAPTDTCLLTGFKPSLDVALSYRNRGDRCEGLYVRPVSGGKVRVVGFHAGEFSQRPLTEFNPLNIGVHPSSASTHIALLLKVTRFNTYYAMDTKLPQRSRRYDWSTKLVTKAVSQPSANELGILACTNDCSGKDRQLIPVALSRRPENYSDYTVLIKPDATLARLRYTLSQGDGADPLTFSLSRRFAAGVTYPLSLPNLDQGKWTLRITGVSQDGRVGVTTERLIISVASE